MEIYKNAEKALTEAAVLDLLANLYYGKVICREEQNSVGYVLAKEAILQVSSPNCDIF